MCRPLASHYKTVRGAWLGCLVWARLCWRCSVTKRNVTETKSLIVYTRLSTQHRYVVDRLVSFINYCTRWSVVVQWSIVVVSYISCSSWLTATLSSVERSTSSTRRLFYRQLWAFRCAPCFSDISYFIIIIIITLRRGTVKCKIGLHACTSVGFLRRLLNPSRKARGLRGGDALLFICSFVRLSPDTWPCCRTGSKATYQATNERTNRQTEGHRHRVKVTGPAAQ